MSFRSRGCVRQWPGDQAFWYRAWRETIQLIRWTMPSIDHFQQELRDQLETGSKRRAQNLVVNSEELHRAVGGYPGPNQRLQYCCDVMKAEMVVGDEIVGDLKNQQAAALTIRYQLPRPQKSEALAHGFS